MQKHTVAKAVELQRKCLLPPWIKYPGQPPVSLFWRMGAGETYLTTFWEWFAVLSPSARTEYMSLFPSPKSWPKPYNDEDEKESADGGAGDARTHQMQLADKVGVTLWSPDGSTTLTRESLLAEQAQPGAQGRQFLFFYGHTQPTDKLTKTCFSQFWTRPGAPQGQPLFEEATFSYVCAEQYMMHNKALTFDDDGTAEKILAETSPFSIKALGRQVQNFDPKVWSVVARSIVCQGNYYKFTASDDLRQFLLDTGDAVLVEASGSDKIWGIGCKLPSSAAETKKLSNVQSWKGENWLGFALTDVREEIRRVYANVHLAE